MKRFIYLIILLVGILFLNGCFKSLPQSDLHIALNGNSIFDIQLERRIKDLHIFKEYIYRNSIKGIAKVEIGETIELEFEGEIPDFVYVTDSILTKDGEYRFDANADMQIECTEVSDGKYTFVVDEQTYNFMIPNDDTAEYIYRGIKIDAFFGEHKISYITVIDTKRVDK